MNLSFQLCASLSPRVILAKEAIQKIVNFIKAKEYLSPCGRGRRVAAGEGLAEVSIAEFKMHYLFLLSGTPQYCNTESSPHPTLRVDLSHKGRGNHFAEKSILFFEQARKPGMTPRSNQQDLATWRGETHV